MTDHVDLDPNLAVIAEEDMSTELAVRTGENLIGTSDPSLYLAKSIEIAEQLVRVIDEKGLYETIRGKRFITVAAWKYLGSMLGVFATAGDPEYVKGDGGGWKATAEARTMQGVLVGRATAMCTRGEKSGQRRNSDEHDLMAMAQTRAMRNALKGPLSFIVELAGLADLADAPRRGASFRYQDSEAAGESTPSPDAPARSEFTPPAGLLGDVDEPPQDRLQVSE